MKSITVNFIDFWDGFDIRKHQIYQILSEMYNVSISDDPQYLFYGPYGSKNLKYKNCIRIFISPENISPDFNLCDYAMGFDYMDFGDRYLRRPNYYGREADLELCIHKHQLPIPKKTEFCSFVVSNGQYADSRREDFFHLLSKYKKVNSGGRFLNNIGIPSGVTDKLEFQRKHKFALALENTSHPGYTTEKIIDAFAAGCVPIYWGDPLVDRVFNPKAFINVGKYSSFEDAVQEIIRIDQDEDAYHRMLAEPAFLSTEDYPDAMKERIQCFLRNIVEQPLESALRRPQGRPDICVLQKRPVLSMNRSERFLIRFKQKKHNLRRMIKRFR